MDVHTVESIFLGYNAYGRPEFQTTRTPLGDLVYRLKNRGDQMAISPITETILAFLKGWTIGIDAIVPIPPSNTSRKNQPVITLVKELSKRLAKPLCDSCLTKVKSTAQLKDVFDRAKREEMLVDAFSVNSNRTKQKRLLLFDDLYRSGATAGTISRILTERGAASSVYLLTLTHTRKHL